VYRRQLYGVDPTTIAEATKIIVVRTAPTTST
jgi:hypothetical protein